MCALCMSNVVWECKGLKKLWGMDVVRVWLQETNNFFLGLIGPNNTYYGDIVYKVTGIYTFLL